MKDPYFCSNLVVSENGNLVQIRPLQNNHYHLRYDLFGLSPSKVKQLWKPKRVIEFSFGRQQNPRPTHPEDRVIRPETVRFCGIVENEEYLEIIEEFTFNSISDLYPDIENVGFSKKYFVKAGIELDQSVGYIIAEEIEIFPQIREILIKDNDGLRIQCKIIDCDFIDRIEAGEFKSTQRRNDVLIRLSLAGAYNPNNEFGTPRCYVMCSQITI